MEKNNKLMDRLNSIMMTNFVYDNEFDYLYHYTDLNSAKLIIESGQLWVSDAFATNDENEIIHVKEIIDKIISDKYNFLETEKKELCTDSFQLACDLFRTNAFILCFSLINDSKPLWKNYAKKNNKTGVCLRFKFNNITPNPKSDLISQERYFVNQNGENIKIQLKILNHLVTYNTKIKYNKIEEYLNLVIEIIKKIPDDNFDENLYKDELDLLVIIFTDILLYSCFSKVSKWKDEVEYRMLYVFPETYKHLSILKSRLQDDKVIKYVSTNLKADNTFSLNRIFVRNKIDIKEVKKNLKPLISDNIKIKSIKKL